MIKEKLTCQEVIQKLVSQTDELIGGKDSMRRSHYFPGTGSTESRNGKDSMKQ